jgi:hypothetical protein
MTKFGFGPMVAARTRAADQILSSEELLQLFRELGGLRRDLETIRKAGLDAEAANLGQSQSVSAGKSATADMLLSFAELQKEYSAVMGIVQAVRAEMARNGGSEDLVVKLGDILKNEATLTVKVAADETGEKKRKASRSASQEALRAEIAKDAGALLELDEAREALTERRVDANRLTALKASADKLAGLLATRAAAKGASKTATKAEREAVSLQRDVWGASYRILAALGAKDARVKSLLSEASASK